MQNEDMLDSNQFGMSEEHPSASPRVVQLRSEVAAASSASKKVSSLRGEAEAARKVTSAEPQSLAPGGPEPVAAADEPSGVFAGVTHLARQLTGMLLGAVKPMEVTLSPEILTALIALDDRLAEVLKDGDIRLVSSAWVLAQDPESFRMPHRQALEAMEKRGVSPSPLLSPQEAEALLRRGQRSLGVLSQYVG